MLGQSAVQDRPGWFCGVGCDLKLESICKSQGTLQKLTNNNKERPL